MRLRLTLLLVWLAAMVGGIWYAFDVRRLDIRQSSDISPLTEPGARQTSMGGRRGDGVAVQVAEEAGQETNETTNRVLPDSITQASAEICGRFVFEDGTPASRVPWEVFGWRSSDEDGTMFGKPSDLTSSVVGITDADGRLSARFHPPRAFQFTLKAKMDRYAGVEWRWDEIEPGAVIDVGEIVLRLGGTIEGRIVDKTGSPIVGEDWTVSVRSLELAAGSGRDETQVIALVDPSTGRYRAEGVLPGRVAIKAYSRRTKWIDGPSVPIASGEALAVDIVYRGPDNSRRITLSTSSDPFYVVTPDTAYIRLTSADGELRTAARFPRSSQGFSFDDLRPGTYSLEIDDPRFEHWTAAFLHPGDHVEAELQGSSALDLRVIDAQGGNCAEYSVVVEFRDIVSSPRRFVVKAVQGRIDGMVPGDFVIRVRAGGLVGAETIDSLAPGETRSLTVVVGSARSITGRVAYANGKGVADAEVLLLTPLDADSNLMSGRNKDSIAKDSNRSFAEVDATITNEEGRFTFALTKAGLYIVRALKSESMVCSDIVNVRTNTQTNVELVLRLGGRVQGMLRGPEGKGTFAGFRVAAKPQGLSDIALPCSSAVMQRGGNAVFQVAEVNQEGVFQLGPIPAGLVTLVLLLPEASSRAAQGGFWSYVDHGPDLGTITIEDDVDIEVDFEVPVSPGTIVMEVAVNGKPAPGLRVQLHGSQGRSHYMEGETDASGVFGPTLAFPDRWSVYVSSPEQGWRYSLPVPQEVAPSARSIWSVGVYVATANLLFLDQVSREPLAGQAISVYELGAHITGGPRRVTDRTGHAAFTLTPGEYLFVLEDSEDTSVGSNLERRSARLTWTGNGPLADRLEL